MRRLLGPLLRTATAAAAVLLVAPAPQTALQELVRPQPSEDPFVLVVAVAALLADLLALWLLLVVAATVAAAGPGRLGRRAGAVLHRLAPTAVRQAMRLALGLTVALGAGATGPAAASPRDPLPGLSLDWPGTPPAELPAELPAERPAERPAELPAAARQPAAPAPTPARAAVVVRPGDSLWRIAADHLPAAATAAQVARAWPAWWAANRAEIGPDPDLITPGTRLAPPPALRTPGA